MAVAKIDPKVIFASEAPVQDTPAVFTNKTVGWGESRKNGGRPTIKQSNALQQETDLKILWLNENSVTPFDATIDYPENAVTLKDDVFKILKLGVWEVFLDKSSVGLINVDNTSDLNKPVSTATQTALNLKADKSATYTKVEVDNAIDLLRPPYLSSDVVDGNQTQDQINLYGGKKYDMPVGGYKLNERVILTNGDIVKSTIEGNTNDPNVDMTGWVKTNSASQIIDESGLSQQQINIVQDMKHVRDGFVCVSDGSTPVTIQHRNEIVYSNQERDFYICTVALPFNYTPQDYSSFRRFSELSESEILDALSASTVLENRFRLPKRYLLEDSRLVSSATMLAQYPIAVDGQTHAIDFTGSGYAYQVGNTGGTGADMYQHDLHTIKDIIFVGGANATGGIRYAPYRGMMGTVKDVVFERYGKVGDWAITYDAQNWWQVIDNLQVSDNVNGIKAIDDGKASERYSGNSRLVINNSRFRWLNGTTLDTTGVLCSAVSNMVSNTAFENAGKGVQLAYPSSGTRLHNLYFEQPTANTKSIVLGDSTAQPNNLIYGVYIENAYANMHANGSNFISQGNDSTTVQDLTVDKINLSNNSVAPVITLSDVAGQSVRAGTVLGGGQLLNQTNNHVSVIDINNLEWDNVINGNGSVCSSHATPVDLPLSQNSPAKLADMFTIITDTNAKYTRTTYSAVDRNALRGASTGIKITSSGGTYRTLTFNIPNPTRYVSQRNILQFFAKCDIATTQTVRAIIRFSNGNTQTLATKSIALTSDFKEFHYSFFLTAFNDFDEDSCIYFEIYGGGGALTSLEYTGFRVYSGDTALCLPCTGNLSRDEVALHRYYYRESVAYSGSAITTYIYNFPRRLQKVHSGKTIGVSLSISGVTYAGILHPSGKYATFTIPSTTAFEGTIVATQ